jgi:GntR family transcriptional regulator / MocR family aminotransferase
LKPVTADLLLQRWDAARAAHPTRPLNRALYECLRGAILDGALSAGTRLPASRELAAELGVSRNSVTHAYDQLLAEGYLRALTGSGTFVSEELPEHVLSMPRHAQGKKRPAEAGPLRGLSRRGGVLVRDALASDLQWGAFMPGVPDVRLFPQRLFARLAARVQRNAPPEWLTYASGGGHPALREALAAHLRHVRSVECEPAQILITEGVHQAVDLVSRVLADPGDAAWMEEPGYWGIRSVLVMNGLRVRGIGIDAEGLKLPGRPPARPPRLIFVSPSHQYPLGSVMSLPRRLELLEFARRHGCWVVEDDYDSDFRFSGHPVPSLQGLAPDGPVIYIGTFSKTLYPGLRIAYVVAPAPLADAFRKAHSELYREGHLITQATLAEFIREGHYAAHIRRMRLVYASRRSALTSLIQTRLGDDWLHPGESNAGLHLVLTLPSTVDDVRVAQRARERGVLVRPLSRYYSGGNGEPGLLLGFACVAEEDMLAPLERLVEALQSGRKSVAS